MGSSSSFWGESVGLHLVLIDLFDVVPTSGEEDDVPQNERREGLRCGDFGRGEGTVVLLLQDTVNGLLQWKVPSEEVGEEWTRWRKLFFLTGVSGGVFVLITSGGCIDRKGDSEGLLGVSNKLGSEAFTRVLAPLEPVPCLSKLCSFPCWVTPSTAGEAKNNPVSNGTAVSIRQSTFTAFWLVGVSPGNPLSPILSTGEGISKGLEKWWMSEPEAGIRICLEIAFPFRRDWFCGVDTWSGSTGTGWIGVWSVVLGSLTPGTRGLADILQLWTL
jgi:hypothetical protein